MPGYLLDTSVLSAFAPDKPTLPPALPEWLRARSEQLFIPCIAIAELEQGICKLRRAGGTARAQRLDAWLEGLLDLYTDHVLPLDAATSRILGRISEQAIAVGRHPGFADTAIAALASRHDLLILTRNLRHFEALSSRCADPFNALPD